MRNNDMGKYNWTGVDGEDPRPYATAIEYYCPRVGWGYPSTGEDRTVIHCQQDGIWSNEVNIESCISTYLPPTEGINLFMFCSELPCSKQPPPPPPGEGAERNYGPEITTYRSVIRRDSSRD